MSSLKQLLKKKHKKRHKFHKKMTKALMGGPQRKGICKKILKESPKKPNSAKRSVAKVKILATGKMIRVHIPGEGHELTNFSRVLIRGGHARDLPGIRYRVMRGQLDCKIVKERRQKISKYGVQSSKIVKDLKEAMEIKNKK